MKLFQLIILQITALSISLLFSNIKAENQKSIQDINGFCFILNTQIIFSTAYNAFDFFPSKLPVLRRETGERIYNLSAFYVANLLITLPRSIIECFFFLTIIYPFVGFTTGGFWMFLKIGLTLTITSIPSTAYGIMLSSIFESTRLTADFAAFFDVTFLVIAGYYKRLDVFWFMKYFSLFFYAYESVSILIWSEIPNLGGYKWGWGNRKYLFYTKKKPQLLQIVPMILVGIVCTMAPKY